MTRHNRLNRRSPLADELFGLVESDQGKAFISDGINVLSDAQIIGLARNSLRHTERTARLLRSFLKKYEPVRALWEA